MNLPHRFPFRWIECAENDRALALVSTDSSWIRGGAPLPVAFVAEIVAQAAALVLEDPAAEAREPKERWLAGIERLELHRPVVAGDLLEVTVTAGRRFGPATRVEGRIAIAGEIVAETVLLLV